MAIVNQPPQSYLKPPEIRPAIKPLFLGGGTWPGGGWLTSHEGRLYTRWQYMVYLPTKMDDVL